jgi:hypothetical protein
MKHLRLFVAAIAAVFGLSANAQNWPGSEVANGKFFLYNVATGTYLCGANDWGTHSSVSKWGIDYTFEGADGVFTLDSRIANNATDHYLGGNYTDAGAVNWTFEKVSDSPITYTLKNPAGQYLAHTTGTFVEVVDNGTTDDAKWILVSYDDIYAAMAEASVANPMDVRLLIPAADPGRNNQRNSSWNFTHTGGNNRTGGDNKNFVTEAWNSTFEYSQTLTGLPNGFYKFSCSGFGTNGTTYVFAGDVETPFAVTTNNGGDWAAEGLNIENGMYTGNETAEMVLVSDGTLKVGVKRTNIQSFDWALFDKFVLTYYGVPDLSDYAKALAAAVAAAQALEGTVPNATYQALSAVVSENNKEYDTAEGYTAATNAIKQATETAKALQAPYSRYNDVKTACKAVYGELDTAAADEQANAATSTEEIEAAVAAVRAALLAALPEMTIPEEGIELTNAIIDNPTVRQNTNYWTAEGIPNPSYSWAVVNYEETEFYQQNFDFYQNLKGLPTGTYEFGVTGFHRAGNHSTYFYAGVDKILIPGVESSVVNNMATAKTYFDGGNGKVALKFALEAASNDIKIGIVNNDTETDRWTIFRDFTLKYFGSQIDLTEYDNRWKEAVAAANAALEDEANAKVTGDELTAITAAKADVPEHTKASYIEKTDALVAATQAFIAAAPAYNAYAAEKAIAEMIGVTPGEDPTTAAAAAAGVNTLKVAEFNFVNENYPFNGEGIIGDFGTWTGTATVAGQSAEPNYLATEHWSGPGAAYYEQASTGWANANGWTIKYEKTATLPAGEYMLKVAARSSIGTTSLVSCSATENTVTLPNKGATGKGIALDGTAAFEGDNFAKEGVGFGWEWRYLPFTLTERTRVTMTFYAEATSQYQWMSIANGTLLSKTEIVNEVNLTGDDTTAPEEGVASKITIDRKLKKGLNTIVLPFDATAEEIGASTVLKYGGTHETNGKTFIHFDEVAPIDGKITLQANTPYAVIVDEDQTENIVFTSMKNIAPAENLTTADVNGQYDFVGTFSKIEPGVITEKDYVARAAKEAFVPAVANDSYLNAYRAYLKFVGTEAGSVAFNIGGEIIDGIEAVELMNKLSDGIYNLNGQKVSNAQKGIYIVNGKKVVLK